MLHNRIWVDPSAESEFWKQMQRLETVQARLSATGGWSGLLSGGPFRRAALQRDLDAIRDLAQQLVERHTVIDDVTSDLLSGAEAPRGEAQGVDPLRALAGMVVSLRQDRVAKPSGSEEQAI